MKYITKKILEETLADTCLYPKYPNGDKYESHPLFPFVDSSISDEQFKIEAQRFEIFNEFWEVIDYKTLDSLNDKQNIFVMHTYREELISSRQLAIPIEYLMHLNNKKVTPTLNNLIGNRKLPLELDLSHLYSLTKVIGKTKDNFNPLNKHCVIKTPYSAAGDGICIFDNEKDLDSSLENLLLLLRRSKARNNDTFIIEDFIEGEDLSLQGFVSRNKEVFYVGSGIQNIGENGEYQDLTVSTNQPSQKEIEVLRKVGTYAAYNHFFGFFGLDLKKTKQGELHIIDPNFRPTDGTPKYIRELNIL